MLMGIDVGGTHTDAVILDGLELKAEAKVITQHDHLLSSIRQALQAVLSKVNPAEVTRLNLSTTLSTNSIIEAKTERVGVIVSAGPGLDPESFRVGGHYFVVGGCLDHRGTVIKAPDNEKLAAAIGICHRDQVKVWGAVGKFSTRNPEHEDLIASAIGPADYITKGHSLSGILNFPRRIATAYFNSAVWRIYNDFAWAVEESLADFNLKVDLNILKADGGTMPLSMSKNLPVESILSGPAASVMGIIALCDIGEDSIILDVGGTTTDIAVFADGAPLVEKEGMSVGSYPTLVRSLLIRSIGIGGDSSIHVAGGAVYVGPDRHGPCLATAVRDDGLVSKEQAEHPALTDAMNYLGYSDYGNVQASTAGLLELARKHAMDPDHLAQMALNYAINRIVDAARDMVYDINEKPVYTIHELLYGKRVEPKAVYIMGGPAQALAGLLKVAMGLEVTVPPHFAVANAIGAALTRTTMSAELFADTKKGLMFIPSLDVRKKVDRSYNLEQAKADALNHMSEYLCRMGVPVTDSRPEITAAESFNMVEGPAATGKNIRVKVQIRPGVMNKLTGTQPTP
jgi:N-methylhydantoinase A/oxoprolinase/acetone carboxylase beta subunit